MVLEGPITLGSDAYTWTSWCRVDGNKAQTKTMPEQWSSSKWTPVLIKAESFTEKSQVYKIGRRKIAALVNDQEKQLVIMTRPAKNLEIKVHDRFPVTVPETMNRQDFINFLNEKLKGDYK